jgi:hypothetical protein
LNNCTDPEKPFTYTMIRPEIDYASDGILGLSHKEEDRDKPVNFMSLLNGKLNLTENMVSFYYGNNNY